MTNLVLVQAVEGVFVETKPGAAGIVRLHHVAPDFYRNFEARFLVPGDGRNLQSAFGTGIKNGAAELQTNRDFPIRQAVEVLGGSYIEIKGAWYGKIGKRAFP